MNLSSYPPGIRWRIVFRFLVMIDNATARWQDISEQVFEKYIRPHIETTVKTEGDPRAKPITDEEIERAYQIVCRRLNPGEPS